MRVLSGNGNDSYAYTPLHCKELVAIDDGEFSGKDTERDEAGLEASYTHPSSRALSPVVST